MDETEGLAREWAALVQELNAIPLAATYTVSIRTGGTGWSVSLWPDHASYAGLPGLADGSGDTIAEALASALPALRDFVERQRARRRESLGATAAGLP